MRYIIKTLVIVALCFSAFSAEAQDEKFKSAYLYQFGRIMNWTNVGNEFVIGIWGDSEITPVIEKIAQIKKIQDKKIVVKKVNNASQLIDCQIIFIPKNASASIGLVKKSIANKGVLIVSEKKGSSQTGAGISYIKVNDKLLFEINKKNIEAGGLKSSLSLERIAYKVY